jgi:glycosyltransferase involved in cell wall biosynthesis
MREIPTVIHMHDVAWTMWERMSEVASWHLRPLIAIETRRIRRDELAACRSASICVNVSATDRQRLEAAAPDVRSTVITPGVDCEALTPVERPPSTSHLVFVGSMNYVPNVDGAQFFVREVLPLIAAEISAVTVSIVGARPTASVRRLADDPRVRVTGFVDDVRPYYAAAAAAIVPLRIAGGVRLKILEAMALGMPIVSTGIGAEGLDLAEGKDLLLADTAPQLAAAAVRLLRDAALRQRLAQHARATAVRRFSWNAVGRTLEGVYESIVPSVAPTRTA